MKKYILMLMCLAALSCNDRLAELEIVEFGAGVDEDIMPLSYRQGSFEMEVVSDGDFQAVVTEGSEWIHFEDGGDRFAGGADVKTLRVYVDANRTILRSGRIVLSRKHRTVEIAVSQSGILNEDFSIEQQNLSAGAEGGFLSAKILTLTGGEDILIETEYLEADQGQWISQARMENNYLKFNVAENLSESIRHAVITVSKKGTDLSGSIKVSQASGNVEYVETTVAALKAMTPGEITDHIRLVGGVVLNDNLEGNGAENRNITAIVQDLTAADRTLYVSDPQGNDGVRLEFNADADLLVRRFDRIEVDLFGAVLAREENPERYMVSGIPAASVLKNEPGGEIVAKKKTMSQLQSSDVYTLVELLDCEIPVRKGPYVPLHLKHYHIINKYPMVIRDKEGSDMHMMVNTTCSWQRDGLPMPQGSGSITGIIVHEHCDNFEWDQAKAAALAEGGLGMDYVTGIGEVGEYQIRPVRKSDIRLAESFEEGFSELVCEFRYCYGDAEKQMLDINYVDGIISSYSDVDGAVTGRMYEVVPEGKSATLDTKRDWTMLGPCKDGKLTGDSPANGNGVIINGKPAYWFISASQEKTVFSEGRVYKEQGSAWRCRNWGDAGRAWEIEFNTEDYTAANAPMSVQFGMINGYGDYIGGPTNWLMEYSVDNGTVWIELDRFTVPDFPQNGNKQVWNCPGHKYMTFNFPEDADVWGLAAVKLRIRPADKSAGRLDSYDGGSISSSVENSMNYFAVRCNKTTNN